MKKKKKLNNVMPFYDFVALVNTFKLDSLKDVQLKNLLKECVDNQSENETAKLFAVIKEIIFRITKLSLFDTQIAAAYSMYKGHIAELPTGEGKTLSAVVTAICFALQGKKVHILVFNDYLAKRDCTNNKEIFEFCGISTGYIDQKTERPIRKKIYENDLVYISAKEAGFDCLRDFLCETKDDIVFPPLSVAIVDEADSVLLDEARIPLVLAGKAEVMRDEAVLIEDAVSKLSRKDVTIETDSNQVWLNDSGLESIESLLSIDNLYAQENEATLAAIKASIDARFLLKRDRDYLVKEGVIEVIDQSTGRVAKKRKFPELLHRAVEAKEKVVPEDATIIYNSMTIQSFLSSYEILCGMTGTINTSKEEIRNLYDLKIDVIPPHIKSIRKDLPDEVFLTSQEKMKAVTDEIERANKTGQPVLVGTASVEQSEELSAFLESRNLPHCVLNARNDEQEAAIIARAGEPFRITVSTNMAGRGVDIKLGGENEEKHKEVTDVGGLYVIGTALNPCVRIDNQLRGRAGRQGDCGKTKFFISLDEPLFSGSLPEGEGMERLRKQLLVSKEEYAKTVRNIQHEQDASDAETRYMLSKYAYILEGQRKLISQKRQDILFERDEPDILIRREPKLYDVLVKKAGKKGVDKAQRQLLLYYINQHWAIYLETMETVRSGIHLVVIGRKDPHDEYHRAAISIFEEMLEEIEKEVIVAIKKYEVTENGIDMKGAGLSGATSTWTYMIDDSSSQFSRLPHLIKSASSKINGAVFTLKQFFKRKNKRGQA